MSTEGATWRSDALLILRRPELSLAERADILEISGHPDPGAAGLARLRGIAARLAAPVAPAEQEVDELAA